MFNLVLVKDSFNLCIEPLDYVSSSNLCVGEKFIP